MIIYIFQNHNKDARYQKDESKVLIMNETNEKPYLLNRLKPSNSGSEYRIFQHQKIEVNSTRELNLIEFPKVKKFN